MQASRRPFLRIRSRRLTLQCAPKAWVRRHSAGMLKRKKAGREARSTKRMSTALVTDPMIDPRFTCFKLAIRESRIHRLGVYALEPIPARRKVIEYTGEGSPGARPNAAARAR